MKNNNLIFKKGSKTFYTASIFFPKKVKKDVTRLYAFVRIADNFVDQVPQDKKSFISFKEETQKAFFNKEVKNEIITDFVALCREVDIEKKWVEAFLDAMEQDLVKKKYSTFTELEKYIYGSAEVIGLMMARIIGLPKEANETARLQGKAFQLINFIRDIDEDLELGRQYIPEEDLKKFKINKLSKDVNPELFKELIRFELKRTDEFQKKAFRGYKYIPRSSRTPIATAAKSYMWTSKQIYKNPMIVFDQKVKPTKTFIFIEFAKEYLR